MRVRLRSGGVALVSLRDYGPLIAQRPSSTPASLYLDGKQRRIVHQVWDRQDERRYVVHPFITIQQLDIRGTPAALAPTYPGCQERRSKAL